MILVLANGKPFRLTGGSSNYYGAYPHYELADSSLAIHGDTEYVFTVVLTDGNGYEVGRIRTQPELTKANFDPLSQHSRNSPLVLQWRNLQTGSLFENLWKRWRGERSWTELKISKLTETRNQWGYVEQEGGSADVADYMTIAITSDNGSFTIPVTYFQGLRKQLMALSVLLTTTERVKTDSRFLPASSITSSRDRLYRIEITA